VVEVFDAAWSAQDLTPAEYHNPYPFVIQTKASDMHFSSMQRCKPLPTPIAQYMKESGRIVNTSYVANVVRQMRPALLREWEGLVYEICRRNGYGRIFYREFISRFLSLLSQECTEE